MTSTVPFPTSSNPSTSSAQQIMSQLQPSELSMVSCNPLTYQVCGFVYDNSLSTSFLDTAELFYESRAGYENPLITATSRALIADIHTLIRQFSVIDIPKPSKILHTILPFHPPDPGDSDPWLRVLRIWSEVEEFSESESFDGHKRSIVEHTLNILLFPDLHIGFKIPKSLSLHASSPEAIHELSMILPGIPSLPVPGTPFAVPSPLHLQLPILTRLSFNEQGRITYHRDVWDMRDVIGLVPGMRVAQWILGRAGAWGLSWIGKRLRGQPQSESLIMSAEAVV
ncbi:hypothetical protein K503DRAFT_718851 [Rhizopogon vinicolor AM-OR11-026]|uniref:Uncharacterized protein n=1 Tax=Rhizopogon vinicolor AM-OR11-026 TaxID=1314800 RepID=A0A1B7MZI1_9AGAM|nr:hypothetical protein K503DRAFT_718851 [Rhizopogon vinicolor AM-OR11-026]